MRLVFIHGINQQGKSSNALRNGWLTALGIPLNVKHLDIDFPFYGDALAEAIDAGGGATSTAMGVPTDDEEREFVASALHQMALDYRLDPEKIAGEQAVAQGPLDDRRLLAILRVLESISPLHGEVVLRVVRQAYAYLKRDEVADAVDAKVRSSLETGPCIVVAHSLGTVVAFKLLRAQTQDVPLFVSLGSPLGLMSVQSALKRPRQAKRRGTLV